MTEPKRKTKTRFTAIVVVAQTIRQTLRSFGENRLKELQPAFLALLLIAIFLYLLHVISPLAPFVYSLI